MPKYGKPHIPIFGNKYPYLEVFVFNDVYFTLEPNTTSHMPSNPDLETKLLSWLDTQGYPLEMRVARAFQRTGFRVIQSDYYTDNESGDSREIDVLASLQERDDNLLVRVTIVAECKSSKDKPWILFSSKECTLAKPARVAQRAASSLGRRVLLQLAQEDQVQTLPIFAVPEVPAYGLTQAFTSGHDVCYGAATAVADAAAAIAAEASQQQRRGLRPLEVLEFVFPVVVTEARLFSATLESDSSIAINEIQSSVLLWRNPLVGLPHTIIHVVSLGALDEFVSDALASAQGLLKMLLGSHREVVTKARERHKLMNEVKLK